MAKKLLLITGLLLTIFCLQAQDSTKNEPAFHDIFVSGYYNHLHDGSQYGMGIAGGYYKRLYAEVRWNYEDLNTFSAFGGYSFGNDAKAFEWELIPMLGFSVGNTESVIPALETNFGYKKFALYSENEYLISTDDNLDNFFYSWSEFTYQPIKWLQAGIVAQRTRLYKTDREIDKGLMATVIFSPRVSLSNYLFDPFDWDRIFFVLGLSISF